MSAVTRHVGLVLKTNDMTCIPTICQPTATWGHTATLSSACYRTGGLPLAGRKLPQCFSLIPRIVSEGPGQCSCCDWYSSVSCGDPRYTSHLFLSRKWPIHQKRCSLWAAQASGGEICVTVWSSVAHTCFWKLLALKLQMYDSNSVFRRLTTWDPQVVPRTTKPPCA